MTETLPILEFSHSEHVALIGAIVEDFAPRFAPGSVPIYIDERHSELGPHDLALLANFGVDIDSHSKMPDVVLHYVEKNWLLLVESVTGHGLADDNRHAELAKLFAGSTAGLVFVTAFPSRSVMGHFAAEIGWETVAWLADEPSHLIHFNGARFLGPYQAF